MCLACGAGLLQWWVSASSAMLLLMAGGKVPGGAFGRKSLGLPAALGVFTSPSSLGMASAPQGKHIFSHHSWDATEKWEESRPNWAVTHQGPFCTRQKCCSKHLASDLDLATLQEQIYWWGLSELLPFLSINTIQHMGGVTRWHGKLCSCPSFAAVSSFDILLVYFSRSHAGHSFVNSSSLVQSDWGWCKHRQKKMHIVSKQLYTWQRLG